MAPLRLIVADDHRIFRQGLRELIEQKTDMEVVGEAANGLETIEQVERLRPDILLLDIQMPEPDGVEVTRRLAATHPEVKIIILTMYRQDAYVLEAIKAGARAYLLKDVDATELISVINRVQRGESVVDPAVTGRVFEELRRLSTPAEPETALSEREREILQLLVEGWDNRTIAARLFLSEKTVGNRLSEIYAKLGVTNRTQAALIAVQKGYVASAE